MAATASSAVTRAAPPIPRGRIGSVSVLGRGAYMSSISRVRSRMRMAWRRLTTARRTFSNIPTALGVPYRYWFISGIDADATRSRAGRPGGPGHPGQPLHHLRPRSASRPWTPAPRHSWSPPWPGWPPDHPAARAASTRGGSQSSSRGRGSGGAGGKGASRSYRTPTIRMTKHTMAAPTEVNAPLASSTPATTVTAAPIRAGMA